MRNYGLNSYKEKRVFYNKTIKNIKLYFLVLLCFFLIFTCLLTAHASVYVNGYFRKDGTYVQPHYRSNPDGNPYNNWSYPGNVNPYTGKVATGNSETYLKNYYNKGSSGVGSSSVIVCERGFRANYQTNQCEKVIIPDNAVLNYFGNDFECIRGFKRNSNANSCDIVVIPDNGKLDYFGHDFECNRGFKKNHIKISCDKVIIPENAELSYLGDDFECVKGFKRNYPLGRCDAVVIPENAALDYLGHDFECNRGFKKNYQLNRCDQVFIPENAELDYLGHDFQCKNGYVRDYTRNVCQPDN